MKYEVQFVFWDGMHNTRSRLQIERLSSEGWSVVGVIQQNLREQGGNEYATVIMQRPATADAQQGEQ